jgi:hypothetical protein
MKENLASFIIQCRANYILGIRPAHQQSKDTEGYTALVQIAKSYFDANRYDDFAGNFMEGQYFIDLWAAHLMLEYGQPNERQKETVLGNYQKIYRQSTAPGAAIEEKIWPDNYQKA